LEAINFRSIPQSVKVCRQPLEYHPRPPWWLRPKWVMVTDVAFAAYHGAWEKGLLSLTLFFLSGVCMSLHIPVLPQEVLHYLAPTPGELIVDATVGVGGHAALLADKLGPTGKLIGIDQDAEMLALARQRLGDKPVELVHGSFEDI